MTTEEKQTRILFAGLTILLCAGIFLYSASLFDRNVEEISRIQSPVSFQERLDAIKDEKPVVEVEEVEPVVVAVDWKVYKNTKYGLEFRYPKE